MENYFKLVDLLPDNMDKEFRKLRNNILFIQRNKKHSMTILIASSSHKEGTSLIAKNLSQIIAEEPDFKVLLVDLNFRFKSIYYGNNNPLGLTDFFLKRVELETIVKQTDVPNLSILPSGQSECLPYKIVDSKEFHQMLDELKKRFSCIIIDSPPIQDYPESTLLASKVDSVILVVQAEKSRMDAIMDTKKKLDAVEANILGVILNRRKHYIPKAIYTRL